MNTPQAIKDAAREAGQASFDYWDRYLLRIIDALVEIASSRENKAVTLVDATGVAEEMVGHLGDEAVEGSAITALTYGGGKRVWDMHFYYEDGTEIPSEEAWAKVREHAETEEETWEWGRQTIVRWVLTDEETS